LGGGRKDSTAIQYDNISQTGSMQSMLSSDNDNENDDNTENDARESEQQDAPNQDSKPKVKMHSKFNDHLKSQDFQVCVTIIEARQLPGKDENSLILIELRKKISPLARVEHGSGCLYSNWRPEKVHEREGEHKLSILQ
jgi:otoferlin